jgi:hypothetical protein
VIDDGRRFLSRTGEQFDLVTIDPPPPIEAAGSSLLYAREFYEVMKKKLKKGALLQQWFPGGPGVECEAIARSLDSRLPLCESLRFGERLGNSLPRVDGADSHARRETVYARIRQRPSKDWWSGKKAPIQTSSFTAFISKEIPIKTLMPGKTEQMISDDRPIQRILSAAQELGLVINGKKPIMGGHHERRQDFNRSRTVH